MRSVKQRWEHFEQSVIPASAGATQRREMKRAFYAGFFESLNVVSDVAAAYADEEQAVDRIGVFYNECRDFAAAEVIRNNEPSH